jgi:hypothetical protein
MTPSLVQQVAIESPSRLTLKTAASFHFCVAIIKLFFAGNSDNRPHCCEWDLCALPTPASRIANSAAVVSNYLHCSRTRLFLEEVDYFHTVAYRCL